MSTDHGSPHFGHWCLGALFALLALAAGAISLSLNITFGLQTSIVAALVFTLSDCAKILLPMVSAALGRWDLRRRMAWGVAIAISVRRRCPPSCVPSGPYPAQVMSAQKLARTSTIPGMKVPSCLRQSDSSAIIVIRRIADRQH